MLKISHIHVSDKKNKGDVGIVLSVQDILRERFGDIEIIDHPVEVLKSYDPKTLNDINGSDMVIIGGGGIFYRYFMPFDLKMIRLITAPIVIFGVGYIREIGSKKMSQADVQSIIGLNNKASLIGVRDYYTKAFLVKNGIPSEKIDLVGDQAVFLEEKKPDGLMLENGVKLGLNLNYSGWLGFGNWEMDILRAYRETAAFFKNEYGASIYYCMHHPDEKNIISKLDIPGMQILDFDAYGQKYAYAQLDLIIGMMLHSCVMAFGALTPEINVAYDLRNKNFARFIHCPELCVNLENLKEEALLESAKNVFNNKDAYRHKFAKRKESIKRSADRFLDKTIKLL